jgi:hypothetical protein
MPEPALDHLAVTPRTDTAPMDDACEHCQPLRERIAQLLEVIDTSTAHTRAVLQCLSTEAADRDANAR